MKNIAVFVSGSGTNLENLAVKIEKGELKNCRIALVVCDNPKAYALERSRKHKLEVCLIEKERFATKGEFESDILNELSKRKIGVIALAGYMRIVGKPILNKYKWKMINIHPALLPKFPGAHAIQDAWEASVDESGVTVHFVDEGVDTGPIIMQKTVKRGASDTIETFERKIHEVEYELYPKVLQMLVDERLSVAENKVNLDGKPLTVLVQ